MNQPTKLETSTIIWAPSISTSANNFLNSLSKNICSYQSLHLKTSLKSQSMPVQRSRFLLTFRFHNRLWESSSTQGTTCSRVQMIKKINGSKKKESSPKLLSRMVTVCKSSAITCHTCNFYHYFRDGGTYNRAITTIIRESYKKIEDFLLKQCSIKIHALTSS